MKAAAAAAERIESVEEYEFLSWDSLRDSTSFIEVAYEDATISRIVVTHGGERFDTGDEVCERCAFEPTTEVAFMYFKMSRAYLALLNSCQARGFVIERDEQQLLMIY